MGGAESMLVTSLGKVDPLPPIIVLFFGGLREILLASLIVYHKAPCFVKVTSHISYRPSVFASASLFCNPSISREASSDVRSLVDSFGGK